MTRNRRGRQLNLGTVPLSVIEELEKKVESGEFTTTAAAGKHLLREGTQRWKEERIMEEKRKEDSSYQNKMREIREKELSLKEREAELKERESKLKRKKR